MSKNKIIVFGGTFDPFTEAHYEIVKELYKMNPHSLYIAPSITDWYRKGVIQWLTDKERCECIGKVLNKMYDEGFENVFMWQEDIYKKNNMPEEYRDEFTKNRHFIDTLTDIIAMNGSDFEYYFAIGSDQLSFFKNWYRWEDILKLAKMIVVNGRGGKTVESDIPHTDIAIPDKYMNVSATRIREQYGTMKNGFEEYLRRFSVPEKETVIKQTPIFTLVRKIAPYADQPDFHPVGINSPDWVTVIARLPVKEEGYKYITVRQLRYGPMKEFDEFPCGMVESDEDPRDAAARELREETGWKVFPDDLVHLGSFSPNPAFMDNLMHYFFVDLAEVDAKFGMTELDEHERLTRGMMSMKEIEASLRENNGSALMGCALHLMKNLIKEEEK